MELCTRISVELYMCGVVVVWSCGVVYLWMC